MNGGDDEDDDGEDDDNIKVISEYKHFLQRRKLMKRN